jgi:hypothetical protein
VSKQPPNWAKSPKNWLKTAILSQNDLLITFFYLSLQTSIRMGYLFPMVEMMASCLLGGTRDVSKFEPMLRRNE